MRMAGEHGKSEFSFPTDFGTFAITGNLKGPGDFRLVLRPDAAARRELGRFRTLGEAIAAVAQQETGFAPWDDLDPTTVPHKIHDLTCWNFFDFPGTKPGVPCSH